jgi:hypothetical protein
MSALDHPQDFRTPPTRDPQPGPVGQVVGPRPPRDVGSSAPGGLVGIVILTFVVVATLFVVIL